MSRAVLCEGLRRLRAKGMHAARLYTAGFNTPARALYQACGFAWVDTMRTFLRRC